MFLNLSFFKWSYIHRHWQIIFRRMTVRRAVNLALNQIEYLLRKQRLMSSPPFLKIDPSIICQLRCLGCSQSSDEFRGSLSKKKYLTFDEFKNIIDPLAPTTLGISLSFYGEPLLNRNIVDIIEYAHSKNVGVTFPTNFSLNFTDDFFERLVKSGLDKLVIALDGASNETYKQYRVGGDFLLVKENVKRLSEIKKKIGCQTPIIMWKFVIFDHNRHEVEIVQREYKKWGFDSYTFSYDFRSNLAQGVASARYKRKKACFWLYNTMNVEVDGTARPCCSFLSTKWDIGNAFSTDIRLLWNNDRYRGLRKGFSFLNYGENMDPVCCTCMGGVKK
jgi:MoaA/NifB/PqqE/SkfB family radical SAM enzyme